MNFKKNILLEQKYFLIFLFLLSLAIRFLVFYFYLGKNENYWQVDSSTYDLIAKNIVLNKTLSADGINSNFYRLPGYSVFLAIFYKIFNFNIYKTLIIQIILASFIPVLIFFLSLILFPEKLLLAKISSLFSSIHLGLVLYSSFFMTESLFVFFLLLFFINFFKKNYFLAGIFCGLAGLVRPIGHYLVFLSIILIIIVFKDNFKFIFKKILYFLSGFIIAVLPWLLRNFLLTGFIFFHTLPGGHFLYFSAARIVTNINSCSYEQAKEILYKESNSLIQEREFKLGRKLEEIEASDIKLNLAVKYFKKYPILTLKNWCTDILRTSLSLYSSELVLLENNKNNFDYFNKDRTILSMFLKYLLPKTKSIYLKIIIYLEIILFIFILLGFILNYFNLNYFINNFRILLLTLPYILLFLVIGLSGGYSRMRLPIEPLLIILSLNFWINIFWRKSENCLK